MTPPTNTVKTIWIGMWLGHLSLIRKDYRLSQSFIHRYFHHSAAISERVRRPIMTTLNTEALKRIELGLCTDVEVLAKSVDFRITSSLSTVNHVIHIYIYRMC